MKRQTERVILMFFVFTVAVTLTGCTIIFQRGRKSDIEKIEQLSSQLDELGSAKNLLAERLKQEIADKQVRLDLAEKGLVITFVADILFDSGKAKIKSEALVTLDKVARVLNENLSDFNIGVEGHTDNVPIKYSGWKSNWELSTARALSVLHYLSADKGVSEQRLAAIGYGEHRPVASSDTKEGRRLNRRVEIVVLPKIKKIKDSSEPLPQVQDFKEPRENLK